MVKFSVSTPIIIPINIINYNINMILCLCVRYFKYDNVKKHCHIKTLTMLKVKT